MDDMIDKARVLEIITAARGISQKTVDAIAALPPAPDAVEALVKAAEACRDWVQGAANNHMNADLAEADLAQLDAALAAIRKGGDA
jgi:hypothetical protein